MNQFQAETIRDAMEAQGYEVTLHPSYSGRGMYGKTTWAVSGDHGEIMFAMGAAAMSVDELDEPDEVDAWGDLNPSDLRTDSLGLGTIVY